LPPSEGVVRVALNHAQDLPSGQSNVPVPPGDVAQEVKPVLEAGEAPSLEATGPLHQEVHESEAKVSNEWGEVTEGKRDSQVVQSAPEKSEIDADLATTLGRPKVSNAPTGKLGALLAGRSMLVPGSVTGEGGEGEGLSDTSQLRDDYNRDQVMSAWADLIQDLRDKNKMGMAATLATGGLTFEDPTLKLVVANNVQYEELKECATELLHFLRVRIGNGGIAFEVEVGEEVAAPMFLTPKDRYQHWASENPALEELRKRLDLDLG